MISRSEADEIGDMLDALALDGDITDRGKQLLYNLLAAQRERVRKDYSWSNPR